LSPSPIVVVYSHPPGASKTLASQCLSSVILTDSLIFGQLHAVIYSIYLLFLSAD